MKNWKQFINKYSITILALVIWMTFFDRNDFFSQIELRQELSTLREAEAFYEEQIVATKNEMDQLFTNDDQLEKFARERYYMKKPEEVVYVLVMEDKG